MRELQHGDFLDQLLGELAEKRELLTKTHGRRVPIAVKVAPDLEPGDINSIATRVVQHEMDGVIATNTTLSREGVQGQPGAQQAGGLSGAPLKDRADRVLEQFRAALPEGVSLIGVGGITCGRDATDKLQRGASLVQFYTGMVYRGPALLAECLESIAEIHATASAPESRSTST